MKNSFSLSSQQMWQKLCLCQQVIQYDRSESTESNSWCNFHTYSIYSLEMWRPVLSEAPDILNTEVGGFKLPERNHCYGLRSPFRAGGHLVHTQSPGPCSEFSKRKWIQEHQNGFASQTSLWKVGIREGFPHCINYIAAIDAAGAISKENISLRMFSLTQCV